jgi:hypothetical protein
LRICHETPKLFRQVNNYDWLAGRLANGWVCFDNQVKFSFSVNRKKQKISTISTTVQLTFKSDGCQNICRVSLTPNFRRIYQLTCVESN